MGPWLLEILLCLIGLVVEEESVQWILVILAARARLVASEVLQ